MISYLRAIFRFDKSATTYLKGWAVLFMMFLHFGSRGEVASEYRYDWSGSDFVRSFQICVPLFLFLSGYGLWRCSERKPLTVGNILCRIFRLFRHYWLVVSPFVIVGLWIGQYQFSWSSLCLNLSALQVSWDGPAWFLALYVELILLYPLVHKAFDGISWQTSLGGFLALVGVTKLLMVIPYLSNEQTILARQLKMIVVDLPIFVEGALVAKFSILPPP